MDYQEKEKINNIKNRSNQEFQKITPKKQKKMNGYQATEEEKKQKKEPIEVMNLKNSVGVVSIGMNHEKDVILTIAEHNQGVERDKREYVQMQRAQEMGFSSDVIYVNNYGIEKSALVYKVKIKKGPTFIAKRIKRILEQDINEVAQKVVPFFIEKEIWNEKKKLKNILQLQQKKEKLKNYYLEKRIEEIQEYNKKREQEERRFLQNIKIAMEYINERKAKKRHIYVLIIKNILKEEKENQEIKDETEDKTEGEIEDGIEDETESEIEDKTESEIEDKTESEIEDKTESEIEEIEEGIEDKMKSEIEKGKEKS